MRNSGLADEIAVLDGLDFAALSADLVSASDGRIGRDRATGREYANVVNAGYQTKDNVIDYSGGANYSGGSSFFPGTPLMPSTVGLADADLVNYSKITNVLPPRKNVVDPSGGANYTGGSSFAPGMPLVVSDAGLAANLIDGGYGKAGLGRLAARLIDGGYGKAGLGKASYDTYDDFAGVPLSMLDGVFGSTISIEDGRIGRTPATGTEYAKVINSGYQVKQNVIDPSGGANYSGGSSFAPGFPLMPSSAGLAELSVADTLDGLSDAVLLRRVPAQNRSLFKIAAGQKRLTELKNKAGKIRKAYAKMTPGQKAEARKKLSFVGSLLARVRNVRRRAASAPNPNAQPFDPTSMQRPSAAVWR